MNPWTFGLPTVQMFTTTRLVHTLLSVCCPACLDSANQITIWISSINIHSNFRRQFHPVPSTPKVPSRSVILRQRHDQSRLAILLDTIRYHQKVMGCCAASFSGVWLSGGGAVAPPRISDEREVGTGVLSVSITSFSSGPVLNRTRAPPPTVGEGGCGLCTGGFTFLQLSTTNVPATGHTLGTRGRHQ